MSISVWHHPAISQTFIDPLICVGRVNKKKKIVKSFSLPHDALRQERGIQAMKKKILCFI